MIPIKYRLDNEAEREYIDKALNCIENAKDYSDKLVDFLDNMKSKRKEVAENILNKSKRFKKDYPDSWCLCGWLVISYEEIADVRKYLSEIISLDLRQINMNLQNISGRIVKIKNYHDLQSRKNKIYKDRNEEIHKIMSRNIEYYNIYKNFQKFNEFYNKWSENKINYWIMEKTELKVCPYCNISYTYSRKKSVAAQLDHFFPKAEYPILALCFYNLVPSCPTCNRIKSDDTGEMASPYKDGVFRDLRITWDYVDGEGRDNYSEECSLATLEEKIKIRIETSRKDEQHNLTSMKIEDAYQQHKDYASEIIKKATIYTNLEAQKLICDICTSAGITPEEVERFYLGNYLDANELKKRPLSKMTKDFYQEIVGAKNRRFF